MAKVFSLTTVTVVLNNPTKGTITIGGAGKQVGSIGYRYTNDIFSMDTTPDGGYAGNFNGSKAGSINIRLRQTSSHVPELTEFIEWCRSNPQLAMSTLNITDSLGNICCSANGVLPTKIPDNDLGEKVGDRAFEFLAGEINSEERNA